MLTVYRRHQPPCLHTSRRFRKCKCPIWVQGSLAGEYVRRSLDLRSLEAASELVHAWEAAGKVGEVRKDVPTVSEAVEKFLADAKARNLKEPSLKKYKNILEKKLNEFAQKTGRLKLHHFDVEAVREFRESWNFSPVTHLKNLEFVKAFFRFCKASGWIEKNPAEALKPPKVRSTPRLPLTDEEITKLLEACDRYRGDGKRLRAMLLLLRYSGLRISDAVQLKRRRVKDGRVHVYTQKTGQPVRVPLPQQVLEALAELPESERYFWSGRGKVKSCIEDWRRSFASLAELAKVEDVSFHRFRNTLAVSLLEKGVPLEDVAVVLGNSSRVVAKHYAPWIRSRQENLEKSIMLTWSDA